MDLDIYITFQVVFIKDYLKMIIKLKDFKWMIINYIQVNIIKIKDMDKEY